MTAFSFFNAFKTKRSSTSAVPDGQRVYAVGDVHGRADLLEALLAKIDADEAERGAAQTQIIFLGDLVDRGPDSKRVLDLVVELERSGRAVRVLRGNHDDVFLRATKGDARATRHLHKMGGRPTLVSYGITEEEYDQVGYDELTRHLHELVPPDHVALLEGMENMAIVGDYVFVHAGVRPGVPLDEQTPEDLCWIRSDFLDHRGDFGGVVIHGHSITDDVQVRSNRIGIDTGAYASDRLTAVGLEGSARWFLST
jgi:serine/threonine protein phosphatase 1